MADDPIAVFKIYIDEETRTCNPPILETPNGGPDNITVDWGDGIIEAYTFRYVMEQEHTYSAPGEYLIKIYGDPHNINYLSVTGRDYFIPKSPTEIIDISKLIDLEEIYASPIEKRDGSPYISLDLSKNTKLNRVELYQYPVEDINIRNLKELTMLSMRNGDLVYSNTLNTSDSPNLKSLDFTGSNMTTLDLSNNKNLIILDIATINLPHLDVSENTKLQTLFVESDFMTTIDVSNNPELTHFRMVGSSVTTLDMSHNLNLRFINLNRNMKLFNLDLSNNTKLNTILMNDVGIFTTQERTVAFANTLPAVEHGTLNIKPYQQYPDYYYWVMEICRPKGWTHMYEYDY